MFDFGATIPFTYVPAYCLPVYASQCPLPDPTQDSVHGCWLGFIVAAISGDWISCACKAQPTYQLFIQRPQSLPLPEVIVPPRGAGLGLAKAEDLLRQRDRHVKAIQDQGRMAWQKSSGYNRRALIEATMSRYKRIIGPSLRSRDPAVQKTEAMMGVDVLNQMFGLGRPVTERTG